MKFLLTCFALLACIFCVAQDSTTTPKSMTYYFNQFRVDGKKVSEKDAKTELMKFPSSAKEYKRGNTWKIASWISAGAGILLVLATPEKNYNNPDKNLGFRIAGWTLAGGSAALLIIGIQHKQNAVKNYNKEVMVY